MANTSPYPRADDVIFIESREIRKNYPNGEWNGATGRIVLASFTGDNDRPRSLVGFGCDEGEAVADLYRELRRCDREEER